MKTGKIYLVNSCNDQVLYFGRTLLADEVLNPKRAQKADAVLFNQMQELVKKIENKKEVMTSVGTRSP